MSKFTKLIKNPKLYLYDAWKKDFEPVAKPVAKQNLRPPSHELPYFSACIKNFISVYPVNSIQYKGESIWPLLRNDLVIQSIIHWANKKRPLQSVFSPKLVQMAYKTNIDFAMMEEYKNQFPAKNLDEIAREDTDFLIFTSLNSVDQVEIEGRIYHKFADPIYENAKKVGSAKKIEIVKTISSGIKKIPKYKNPVVSILPPHIYKEGYSSEITYDKKLVSKFKKYIPYMPINDALIEEFFDWQFHMIDFFTSLLKKYNPKVIFLFPYFYHGPLIYAANKLGIKTVDIQHGIMSGENELTYDNWKDLHKNGSSSLPTHFWVWGEYEYTRLKETVFLKKNDPDVIIGGNPWLENIKEMDNSKLTKIKKSLSKHKYSYISLITLQHPTKVPPHLIKLIEATDKEVVWIFRKHPKGINFDIKTIHTSNVIASDELNTIEISKLFSIVDTHFTAGSTTVLEADYFGVYSFIYDISGYKNYKEFIDIKQMGYFPETDIDKYFLPDKKIDNSLDFISKNSSTTLHENINSNHNKMHNIEENMKYILETFFNSETTSKIQRLNYIKEVNTENILRELLEL